MRRGIRISLIAAIGIVVVIVIGQGILHYLKQPRLNHKPKYFFTVKGRVAPQFLPFIRFKYVVYYSSSDSRCFAQFNYFEGVGIPRIIRRRVNVTPLQSGKYEHRFALDYFESGYCHWRIDHISSQIIDNQGHVINSGFEPVFNQQAAKPMYLIGGYNLRCVLDAQTLICKPENIHFFGAKNGLSDMENYIYTVNILKEKFNHAKNY